MAFPKKALEDMAKTTFGKEASFSKYCLDRAHVINSEGYIIYIKKYQTPRYAGPILYKNQS